TRVVRAAQSDPPPARRPRPARPKRALPEIRRVCAWSFPKVARSAKSCHRPISQVLICVRMSGLSRVGVAIDSDLLDQFDRLIGQRGYTNRSEAFRDLIRDELVEKTWESPDSYVVGTVTLVYDHHVRMLNEKLTGIQHDF